MLEFLDSTLGSAIVSTTAMFLLGIYLLYKFSKMLGWWD